MMRFTDTEMFYNDSVIFSGLRLNELIFDSS